MAVQTVPYTMQVPKEGKEIIDAQHAITKHFRNGGSVAEAATLLPALMTAVDGASAVVDEMKSQYNDEMAGYGVHKLWDSLKKDEPEAAPAE